MFGIDPDIGTTATLRLWVSAGSAALLVVICFAPFVPPLARTVEGARTIFGLLGAVLGAAIAWGFLGIGPSGWSAERRALEMRAEELTVRALAPGLPLACLDPLVSEIVETDCEKAIFASPTTVATATSYVAARFALLSDIAAHSLRTGTAIDAELPLRRSLEADRFGFLAHVLTMRDGCTSTNCKALALLNDPSRVRSNLSGKTLDRYLEHYRTVWSKSPDGSVADATQVQPNAATQINPQGPRKAPTNIDFPTPASIPPVNIMIPEPTGAVLPGPAAANPNSAPAAASSPHRSHKQVANPPAQADVHAAASSSAAPVAPIWPEPVPSPPHSTAAPVAAAPASAVPAGAAPTQLNPFAPSAPTDASAGMTVRAQ